MLSLRVLVVLAARVAAALAEKPHIFMVLVDDWGWNDVGFHKEEFHADLVNRDIRTPNIDGLVKEGLKLDRHYTYSYCSPTRSSLQSGRLPVHVVFTNEAPSVRNPEDADGGYSGIPRNMTGIAAKLRSAGYRTHMTGKWDCGMASWDHTPMGRGYETFFGYFHHANDYWNQTLSAGTTVHSPECGDDSVDLWNTSGPAVGLNGTAYEEELFTRNTLQVLEAHDPAEPLFLFHSFHIVHTPLQVPEEYEKQFRHLLNKDHRKYAAMVHYMDEQLGKFVDKLKAKGMWDKTLMVVSSDNGGPIYGGSDLLPHLPGTNKLGGMHGAASNRPLRGGKMSDWEGGIRVNAFVSGGLIPEVRRGGKVEDYIHVADWYSTFCHLAGVDPHDERAALAGLPAVDSVDQLPVLLGEGAGNRTEIHISQMTLIQGPYKLLTGGLEMFHSESKDHDIFPLPIVPMDGKWDGFGLASDIDTFTHLRFCRKGCLFNIQEDPFETKDLSTEPKFQKIRDAMKERLQELNKDIYRPNRGSNDPAACAQVQENGGFYGPWVDLPKSFAAAHRLMV